MKYFQIGCVWLMLLTGCRKKEPSCKVMDNFHVDILKNDYGSFKLKNAYSPIEYEEGEYIARGYMKLLKYRKYLGNDCYAGMLTVHPPLGNAAFFHLVFFKNGKSFKDIGFEEGIDIISMELKNENIILKYYKRSNEQAHCDVGNIFVEQHIPYSLHIK